MRCYCPPRLTDSPRANHPSLELTYALLSELPTSSIASIVERLNPRLYIDFIQHLPAEICLKILGYLDPVSLVSVLRTCRLWYDLGLDRKLWERLYHLEGWKAIYPEIERCEAKINEHINASIGQLHRTPSEDDGPAAKVRGIMNQDEDVDMMDGERTPGPKDSFTSASVFGSPGSSFSSSRKAMPPMPEGDSFNSASKGKGLDTSSSSNDSGSKRKAPADESVISDLPMPTSRKPSMRSSLWVWDVNASQYRINWKYLYNTRRALESNWDLGKYTTFVLPHPDFPDEGHQECVYTIQFDAKYLVSGSRDRTMRIWNTKTRRLARAPLIGHSGSVLCLQFDADPAEDIIVSGSSDSDVLIWKFSTGEILQKITKAHRESVLNVRFDKRILVTSSKDKTIKIFNRRPLRYGDLGYETGAGVVYPVGVPVKPYGYEPDLAQELPVRPPWSQIARLDGHGAAVNAIQVRDRTIVSVSGDRQIKIWDWPRQVCEKTIPAHEKGIACVEFDGRRIVSGSSDYEVGIFDAITGLKISSLRTHGNLVRTVQAGFADLPDSRFEDEREARVLDAEYTRAVAAGEIDPDAERRARQARRANNPNSRAVDVQTFGAKIPPGGGGGRKYGRIVSGSYDQTIIVWRRDKESVWKPAHFLRQEAAVEQAHQQVGDGMARSPASQASSLTIRPSRSHRSTQSVTATALHPTTAREAPTVDNRAASMYLTLIDQVVPAGVGSLQQALSVYPGLLRHHTHLQATIEREPSPFVRSQMRSAVTSALVNLQSGQASRQRAATQSSAMAPSLSAPGSTSASPQHHQVVAESSVAASQAAGPSLSLPPAPMLGHAQPLTHTYHGPPRQHHPHLIAAENAPARVFKLQFDARKIVCCTQAPVIVGWDFCNGEADLEEVSRFFATVD